MPQRVKAVSRKAAKEKAKQFGRGQWGSWGKGWWGFAEGATIPQTKKPTKKKKRGSLTMFGKIK